MSNYAAVLKEENAKLTIEERPIPKPGPSDVVVKNHAHRYQSGGLEDATIRLLD